MDVQDLYKEIIVDHNRSPRNFRRIDEPTHQAEGFNPLCGDKLKLYLTVDSDVIKDIAFEGSGCAISVASASMLTEALLGKNIDDAGRLFERMRALFTEQGDQENLDELGKLAALGGVRQYPSRIKCANLSWHALHAALDQGVDSATTE
ncbi:MAG: Fe-S cluster assembly sulfur transfer protein SufU [Gammaproteobacteria bacterium]